MTLTYDLKSNSFHEQLVGLSLFAFQSLLDDQGLVEVTAAAKKVMNAVNKGQYTLATELWSQTEEVVEQVRKYCLASTLVSSLC